MATWNHAVAHLSGAQQVFEDEDALADLVARTSARFGSAAGQSWHFEHDREDRRRQLRGIIGFRFGPSRIELKFKLNQNHPVASASPAGGKVPQPIR